ncbi:helix-hairpin-helix domain-containing protein [Lysobacter sp. LF1]|uniref:Helix-hairpin-helix domain-containing protein n=1 Tax=Lysobacter stagni TaxID=3045172 RepID=A0ABT6XF55_9GAMM|nr:helix-hairpin-helix domain-containing protein [Lysobacter sp. LF1]MDI9238770.1 helix-hairpin-helix domain-containing protein [Lysobacter sp. LF1]
MARKIDLNSADAPALAELPGIGSALAERIIEYRERVGRFRTIDEVTAVAGISERALERVRDRVSAGEGTAAPRETESATQVRVSLHNAAGRPYTGHALAATFVRREILRGADGNPTSIWVPASTGLALPPDGQATLVFPARSDLQGNVTFSVRAPDGQLLLESALPGEKLPERVDLEVAPQEYAKTSPNDAPGAGKPARLKGRVIDEAGRRQLRDIQVVVWAARPASPTAADFLALLVAQTDANGYFNGPYPLGTYSTAHGMVAVGDGEPVQVPIHLEEDGTFPESVILVIDLDELAPPQEEDECDCHAGELVPRDPDASDLARADGTYSNDPGAGRCVDFTRPDRTLEEFSFSYVVRTTEPAIKGLTLSEPAKIDLSKIVGLLPQATLSAQAREVDAAGANVSAMAATRTPTLATDRLDANILQTLARDPDGFSLTKVAAAAELTVHGDLLRVIGQHLGLQPGRQPMSCRNPADWDHEATLYQACTIAHGHVLRFKQEWVADGYSMGNLLYSLPLAPGQKKQIAVVDWERRESSSRTEALEARDALEASISRDRDINEIVNGTVSENVRGGSSSSTGSIAGGLGVSAILGPVGGLLGIGGGFASAGTESWQDSSRRTAASALNQLRDRTIQSASSLRSQRSTVVQTVRQGERVVATTESVANYNHCHAVTIQYFEVLRHLLVRQRLTDVQECLFVPLLMSRFDSGKALRWRNTLRNVVGDRRLRPGFDALERIRNQYVGSDFPDGTYADQLLEHLEGDITLRFEIARPRDADDDFDANAWLFLGTLFPSISASDFYRQHLKGQALKDRIFQEQLAPKIAERFVQHLQFFAVSPNGTRTRLPVDTTLVSDFINDRPLFVSVNLAGALPPVRRRDIQYIEISDISGLLNIPFLQILPTGSKVIVESGTLRYRTHYSSGHLFQGARILNDVVGGDAARVFAPLSREELRNPKQEDKELSRNLLDHLNEHLEQYHHCLWYAMSEHRRYMLLDGFQAPNADGRSVASVVENELIGIVGNCLVMPVARGFHLDPTYRQDIENPVDLLEHYQPNTPIEPSRIAVPTRGVYAEAVMGACNSCERKEEERFWRWEESPLPDQPPPILPVSTDTRRAEVPDLTAKDFAAPIINLQNAPAAPDPTGLAAAMQLLGTPNLFKDITGLEGTQKNAAAALQGAFDTAQFFGGKAADLALQAKMARDIDKAVKTIDSAKQRGLISDAQAQDLTKNAISGMIGGGAKPEEQSLNASPEVKQAIKRATGPGGEVNMSRVSGGEREDLALRMPPEGGRSWIIEPADALAWARSRSFSPSATNPSKTGRTVLKVTTRPIPEGGSVRWSVPPDQKGRYTLGNGQTVQNGLKADVAGLRPGLAKIDFDVFDADGTSVESQKYDLSIPQFVSITENSAFDTVLTRFGLTTLKADVLVVAKATAEDLLSDANVRLVWTIAPFTEKVPTHLPNEFLTHCDIGGDPSGAVASLNGLLGITRDRNGNFNAGAAVGPNDFDEVIDVFPGAMTDPNATDIDDSVIATIQAAINAPPGTSNPQNALAVMVVGRILGASLAHEVAHALVGFMFPGGASHTNAQRDLLRRGSAFTFEHLTGIQVTQPATFPDAGSFVDLGIGSINRPQVDGTLPGLQANFPVPPTFR